ncbi:MAG: DsrE family protein [Pseudomonadota bacterium]
MRNDLLIHIDSPEPKVLHLALNNISNFIVGCGDEAWNVVVIANGPAIKQFTKANLEEGVKVTALSKQGVKFHLCNNAKMAFSIDEADMLEGCEIIPAGMNALVAWQNQGYAYVKP